CGHFRHLFLLFCLNIQVAIIADAPVIGIDQYRRLSEAHHLTGSKPSTKLGKDIILRLFTDGLDDLEGIGTHIIQALDPLRIVISHFCVVAVQTE
ncbi:hypothetical protein, partial [Pseudomonas savastanoi]|uniref:hypothetical protein n=1 Tax=Pseudomonas savastanoi TaxID=29438 RepID=UPI001C81A750